MTALPRSLTTLAVVLVLIAGCAPTAGAARHATASPRVRTWPEAITACRHWVHDHVDPDFDAYAPDASNVRFVGSEAGKWQFEKCMAANGQPIQRLASTTPTQPAADPETVGRNAFLQGCTKDGTSVAVCSCTWTRLRATYSIPQIVNLLQTNTLDPIVGSFDICQHQIANAF